MNAKVLSALKEGGLGAGINTAASIIPNSIQMAELPQNSGQNAIDALYSRYSTSDSMSDLQNLFDSTQLAKTSYNWRDVMGMSDGQAAGNIIGSGLSGASAGMAAGPIGGAVGGLFGLISSGFSYLARKRKAKREAARLNKEGSIANSVFADNFSNSVSNAMSSRRNQSLLNIAALGGPLDTTFTNGVRFITEGGSHEQNPLGGILQGIASDGIPNLVEEGETIYNDYVYSKRLKVPQADKESLGLKKDKEYTYADAAKQIQKESEERPNDPISKRNLAEMMGRLQSSQEALKEKKDSQTFKKAINNMTPDELVMFMQQLQQPQQMQPMMAMQGMQPMQPTQSEVPMFATGGHLFKFGDKLNWNYPSTLPNLQAAYEEGLFSDLNSRFKQTGINAGANVFDTTKPLYIPELTYNAILEGASRETGKKTAPARQKKASDTVTVSGDRLAQALRAAPVLGSLASSIASMADSPNYSNIEKAERAMTEVPRVGADHLGQRMSYTPVDINYIATQLSNQALGARRALNEYGAGNPAGIQQAQIANNYTNQVALANALMQANQLNRQNLAQTLEFNRQTDSANIANDLQAAITNQQRDMTAAEFLMRTGQLRDAELGRVQANRSANLTNLFNNLGNLGQDMLNRKQAAAMAESYGIPLNNPMEALYWSDFLKKYNKKEAKGGKLNTKKGGKDA